MTPSTKQPREPKKISRVKLSDTSAHPDHLFTARYVELGLIEDAAILNAWSPTQRKTATL